MRSFVLATTLAEAARVGEVETLAAETALALESFIMLELVAMASGWMNMTLDVDHSEENKICDSLWPS